MASKKARKNARYGSSGVSSDELLDELASFLYDAYSHSKENDNDKIKLEEGLNAENEGTKK